MRHSHGAPKRAFFDFPFYSLRNISCPEDKENGRTVLCGSAPLTSILDISTDENVRTYFFEAEGRKRRRPTNVNIAIRDTLENNPDKFSVLNSGVVIVARAYELDEGKKLLRIKNPSIINGAQTQGVVRDFFRDCERSGITPPDIYITFQVLVTDDEELIAETSIARNFQNDVMSISISGRLGELDELEEALQRHKPNLKLQKSETQLSEDYLRTEKLLQVITALIPPTLWLNEQERDNPNKVYAYSQKARCLKEFRTIYERQQDAEHTEQKKYKALYEFYLDIVAEAQDLYDKWKVHSGFIGTRLKAIKRDEQGRTIEEIPDGIIFPILASLSAFATKTRKGWTIVPPPTFSEKDLILHAAGVYQNMAGSNPNVMGKSRACYFHLFGITSLHRQLYHASSQG
jgi:AIPR protein